MNKEKSNNVNKKNKEKELSSCYKLWFVIPISLQPDIVIDLLYFKLLILLDQIV